MTIIAIQILKRIFKGPKAKRIFPVVYNFATILREFFTGFVIFEILIGAFYEAAFSTALQKRDSIVALASLFISYLVITLYTAEVMLMFYEASKYKIRKIESQKTVIFV